MKNKVIIGLGSNIDPERNLTKARAFLEAQFSILGHSQIQETTPIGVPAQNNFLNGAMLMETTLDPEAFKTELRTIEDQLDRQRDNSDAPRTIDLDIVAWNGKIIDQDVYEREFLKKAVLELCPELTL